MRKAIKVIVFAGSFFLGAVVLLYVVSSGTYSVPETISTNSRLPGIELNSYTFHSETFGNPESEPVLVLHGGPGADYRYLYPLKALSDHYHLIFFDQRGTGLSPRVSSSTLSLKKYLEDVDAFVEFYGKGRPVHLIGHSWGAMLAAAYTEKYPHKVKSLVLAEPGPLTVDESVENHPPSPAVLGRAGWAFAQSMHMEIGNDSNARMDYIFHAMMEAVDSELFHVKIPLKRWRGGYAVFRHFAMVSDNGRESTDTIHLTKDQNRFRTRVLFLSGEDSTVSGADFQKKNMKLFPDHTLVIVKGAGHYMLNENPEDSIRAIEHYLKEIQ